MNDTLGDMRRLRNLIIITNSYTECVATPVDYRVWKACRKVNPKLRVHLVTEGKHKKEITFQHRAPVKSIVYDTPYTQVVEGLSKSWMDKSSNTIFFEGFNLRHQFSRGRIRHRLGGVRAQAASAVPHGQVVSREAGLRLRLPRQKVPLCSHTGQWHTI